MAKTDQSSKSYPLNFDGKNIFVWLLQSSIVVALATAILYAFGANFDYRLRWEFGMQNVQFVRTTADMTYDGIIVVSAWFKTFQPYLMGIGAVAAIFILRLRFFTNLPPFLHQIAKLLLCIILLAASGLIINSFLQGRAARIAAMIRERSTREQHSVLLSDGTLLEGYVISSSDERTAILLKSGQVAVVGTKDMISMKLGTR